MSVPFSRTQRALADDHFYVTLILTPLVTCVIVGVLYWLFYAQIAVYTASESATARSSQFVTARFSISLLEHLDTTQSALFYMDGLPAREREPIAVHIVHVDQILQDGLVEMRLQVAEGDASSLPLQRGVEGVVEIQTYHQTPIQLMLQTIGARFGENGR